MKTSFRVSDKHLEEASGGGHTEELGISIVILPFVFPPFFIYLKLCRAVHKNYQVNTSRLQMLMSLLCGLLVDLFTFNSFDILECMISKAAC